MSKEDYSFGIGQRVSNNSRHWKEWTGNKHAIDKPTLLVVGGIQTRDARAANGNIKCFRSKIDKAEQVLGLYYMLLPTAREKGMELWGATVAWELMQRGQFKLYNEDWRYLYGHEPASLREIPYQYADWFFVNYVLPMLRDKSQNPLPVEQAIKNMRNLNIATYCWGDFFTDKLSKAMKKWVPYMGYSELETAEIMKQVCVLNLTGSLPANRHSGFTTLRVFSICDRTTSMFHWGTYNKFLCDTYWDKQGNRGAYVQINPNEALLTVQRFLRPRTDKQTGQQLYHQDDYSGEHIAAVYADLQHKSKEGAVVYHMWRNFIDQIMRNSVRNAQSKEYIPLPDLSEMVYPLRDKGNTRDEFAALMTKFKQNGAEDYARFREGMTIIQSRFPTMAPTEMFKSLGLEKINIGILGLLDERRGRGLG